MEPEVRALLALSERQGYVTWQQISEVVATTGNDPEAVLVVVDVLERRGVVLVDDSADSAERDQSHLAEMRRKPCWQLGDSWHFAAEADPYPCRSTAPTIFRLRCGYRLDRSPDPDAVSFRVWVGPIGYDRDEPPAEFYCEEWEVVAARLVSPGEFRLWLPAGIVFVQFRVDQPDYRPEPWVVSWRLEVG